MNLLRAFGAQVKRALDVRFAAILIALTLVTYVLMTGYQRNAQVNDLISDLQKHDAELSDLVAEQGEQLRAVRETQREAVADRQAQARDTTLVLCQILQIAKDIGLPVVAQKPPTCPMKETQ